MIFNGLDDIGRQGKMRLFGLPELMKQGDRFMRCIKNQFFRQQGAGGKMAKFIV